MTKPKTGIKLKENAVKKPENCEPLDFDPREIQKELEGKNLKVYKRGDKFYVQLDEVEDVNEPEEEEHQPNVESDIRK